jgi:ureidoacrylate peracid hydrolase
LATHDVSFRYDPTRAALIVIDVQNDFCDPSGALGAIGIDMSAVEDMVPRLLSLVEAARAAAVPVVFVKTNHDETTDSAVWLGHHDSNHAFDPPGAVCRPDTWGSEFYRVDPRLDRVVVKSRYSAFVGTTLDIQLRTLGVESLLFTGVTTETCVESSVREGLFHEYHVSLVEDCCASYERSTHDASVKVIGQHFGTVISSAELKDHWQTGAAAATQPGEARGAPTP